MTTAHPPADQLDTKAVIGAPIAAFFAVFFAAIISIGITRTIPAISQATGQDIPFLLGSLLVTLGAFGGFMAGEVSLTVGTVGFTFVSIPFILTALSVIVLFKIHRHSELHRPHHDPADRLIAAACSGMILLICSVFFWFIADLLNPDTSRASLTSNVFLLAAGSLAIGTIASVAGRASVHRYNPAWSFTFRYALATGLPVALVACVVLTISYEWGSSSWLLIGNMAAAIWSSLHAGLINWDVSLGALGGPNDSGFHLLLAGYEGIWTIIGLPLGAMAIIFATVAWRKQCMSAAKWALPAAFAVAALFALGAGTWASGYVRVGADASRLSFMALLSPLNVPIMAAIGWLIDRLARLGYRPEHSAQPQRSVQPHL